MEIRRGQNFLIIKIIIYFNVVDFSRQELIRGEGLGNFTASVTVGAWWYLYPEILSNNSSVCNLYSGESLKFAPIEISILDFQLTCFIPNPPHADIKIINKIEDVNSRLLRLRHLFPLPLNNLYLSTDAITILPILVHYVTQKLIYDYA